MAMRQETKEAFMGRCAGWLLELARDSKRARSKYNVANHVVLSNVSGMMKLAAHLGRKPTWEELKNAGVVR